MSIIPPFHKTALGFFISLLLGSSLAFAQVTITGTLVGSDGVTPVPNASVSAWTQETVGTDPTLLAEDADGTDASGQFVISVPADTIFGILVESSGVAFIVPAVNTAGAELFTSPASGSLDIGTFAGQDAVTITGTLVGPDGVTPIQNARIFAEAPAGPGDFPDFLGGDFDGTDASGLFSFSLAANTSFEIFIDSSSTPGVVFGDPAVNTAGVGTHTSPASGTWDIGTFVGQSAATITGTVVGSDGVTPIENAVLFAETLAGPGGFPEFLGGDFDGTDASGNFSFSVAANTSFRVFIDSFSTPGVTFSNPGVNTAEVDIFTSPASGSLDIGTFAGQSAATITGTLVGSDGVTPIQNAVLFAETLAGPGGFPEFLGGDFDGTDASGNFSFSVPANTSFQVFIDSFSTPGVTFSNPAVNTDGASFFTSPASGSWAIGTFAGQSAATITGTVVGSDGVTPIQGVMIFAEKPAGPGSFPEFLGGDFNGTDASGQFSFSVPANTSLQIFIDSFSTPGVTFANPAVNTAGAGTFTSPASGGLDIGTFKGQSAATITGTVVGSDGVTPIQGVMIFAEKPAGPGSFPEFLGGDFNGTDASGQFSFSVPADTNLRIFIDSFSTPGVTFANPAVNTAGASTFTSPASGSQDIGTFAGQSAAVITGTVVGSDGVTPIQGVMVFAEKPTGPGGFPEFLGGDFNGTDASGQFSFSVPANTSLQIFIDSFSTPGVTFANPAVNTAGANLFTSPASGGLDIGTFAGKSAATITGTVVGSDGVTPIQGVMIFAEKPTGPGGFPEFLGGDFDGTDASGQFSFSVPVNTIFEIFIDSFSTPGVTFANPAVNTAGASRFTSPASGGLDIGTFAGQSAATITGTVVGSDGVTPIQNAMIFALTPAGPGGFPEFLGGDFNGTDASGQFSFSVPANTIFEIFIDSFSTPGVTFANPAVNTSGASTHTSPASGSQDIGTFAGQSAATITGTVVGSDGVTPIQNAMIFAEKPAESGSFSEFLGGDFDGTDASGQFSFSVPANTTFEIFIDSFSTPGVTFANPAVNTAAAGIFTSPASGSQDIGTFKGQSATTITGTVVGSDGVTPLQGVLIFAEKPAVAGGFPQFLGGDFDGTDASGQFSFPVPANTSLEIFIDSFSTPGVTFANPAVNTAGTSTFTSPASGSQDIGTFAGQSAATITGTVVGSDGVTPIQNAVIFAQTPAGPGSFPVFLGGDFDGTDASGQFSFSVPANTSIQVFIDSFSTPGVTFANPAVNTAGTSTFTSPASGSTNTGTFAGQSAVTLTGTVQNASGSVMVGALIFAQTPEGVFLGGDFNGTDSSGQFSFSVPAGSTGQIFADPSSTPGFIFAFPAVNTAGIDTFTAGSSGTTDTGTFQGVAAVTVTGTVTNTDGSAVSGAFVFAQDAATGTLLGGDYDLSDSSGAFSFPVPAGSTFNVFIGANGLTFSSPAVNTGGQTVFEATAPGPVSTGTFQASP